MCLTTADNGKLGIHIVGPPGTSDFWSATRHFMYRKNFCVTIQEANSLNLNLTKDIVDCKDMLSIDNELSLPPSAMLVSNDKDDLTIHCISINHDTNSLLINNGTHLCYSCITPEIPGKFDTSKATTLNIPKGPLYGKLKNGFEVVLEDGTRISPSQVLGPGDDRWVI
jgi:ribonuclease Z